MTKKPAPKSKPEPKKDAPEPADKKQPDAQPGEPADTLDPIEDQGVGVRDPYPTGAGVDQREEYYKIHGRYPPEEG